MDLFDDEKFVSDGMNIIERKVKRVIDCLLAFLCLVVFSPLFVILYILIKREDGGGVIYKALEDINRKTGSGNAVILLCDGGEKYLNNIFNDEWMINNNLINEKVAKQLEQWI